MSTGNNIELLIITFVLSLFFLASSILVIFIIKLIIKVHKLADKAESAVESVESAANSVKNFSNMGKNGNAFMTIVNKIFANYKD
jgi:uncharacterized protein YoxC